ncbi:MAG: 4-hydroxy-tetrahydrodipicolinate synthase [Sandaracinaceae bacterium]|nr:4-hydroxy-tetrahydrodipicolinate synthase [Sandaracinaceae bacterium]MDW8246791.1 4-hydroxy-tetrahydrodipicolinate synthase [Sandaracinaceae bacterium]
MTMRFEGTFPALVTPFAEGAIDEEALRALVSRCTEGGVEGLVPCGTTGESPALSQKEHEQVVRIVIEEARGKVPVIAGVGTASTQRTIENAQAMERLGADALLVVCPYYNRPTQAGLLAHFRAVAQATGLPIILYNIPGRTGVDLALETLEQLAELKNIVGIKEATGNVLRSQAIVRAFGDRFVVLSGDDALTLPILAVGGKGVISVTANLLPRETSEVVRLWRKGAVEEARQLHLRLLPVHESLFIETNPGPIKAALADRGWIRPEIRLPLVWPAPSTVERIRNALKGAGLG